MNLQPRLLKSVVSIIPALSILLYASMGTAMDESHTGLSCDMCHLETPVTTSNAEKFISEPLQSLCATCHETTTEMRTLETETTVQHNSFMTIPAIMQTYYANWLTNYNNENGTNLSGFRLFENADGSFSTDCRSCHNLHGGNLFPDIPMTNAELCISCHGGYGNYDPNISRNVYSSTPRILYNPQHLGVTSDDGTQFLAPSHPNYDGQPPANGDTVSGMVSLPVSFFFRFHTNIIEHLNYQIDTIGPDSGSYVENISHPLSWYTGFDNISRWPEEKPMYQWDTENLSSGDYEVHIIPYNPIDNTDIGNALVLNLSVQGSLTAVEMIQQLLALVESLNLHAGIDNSLDAKLEAVLQALSDINEANDVAASNTLQAFIQAVQAQSGNKISVEDADTLIETALAIIAFLNS